MWLSLTYQTFFFWIFECSCRNYSWTHLLIFWKYLLLECWCRRHHLLSEILESGDSCMWAFQQVSIQKQIGSRTQRLWQELPGILSHLYLWVVKTRTIERHQGPREDWKCPGCASAFRLCAWFQTVWLFEVSGLKKVLSNVIEAIWK